MKEIKVDELVEYKILPFNLYNESGDILASAGDNITPGKLLQLRYIKKLFCDDDTLPQEVEEEIITPPQQVKIEPEEIYIDTLEEENDPLENSVNYHSSIDEKSQLRLKSIYKTAFKSLNTKIDSESVKQIKHIRDKLLDCVLPVINRTYKKSQLKIIGNYERYHGLNVALLTAMLAKKMNYTDAQLSDVTLGALLHDIGKTRLPKEFHNSYAGSSSTQSTKMYELHPELGYKILKNEMKLSEDISIIALEHHEKNDGTGYPFGVSSDLLHTYSQMVSICNLYDNIISMKSPITAATPQEAVKKIIELGTDWFIPEVLYSFVYMTTYHDDIPIDELCRTGVTSWE